MSNGLNGVQVKVKDAIFIHCLTHKLNLVSIQAALHIPKCNIFFFNFWRTIVILYIIVKKNCSAG